MTKFEQLLYTVNSNIRTAERELAKFTESLAKDPAYALSWGASAFDAAGALKVNKYILHALETAAEGKYEALTTDNVVGKVVEELTRDIVRAATHPARSTSVQSNLMEQSEAAAKGALLDAMKWMD